MTPPLQTQTLITSRRLVLIPARKSDYQDWAKLRRDSRAHLEPWEPSWGEDALSVADWKRRVKAWNAGWREGRAFIFLVRTIEAGELVGGVSLTNVRPWPAQMGSVGYWLGHQATGQGYMSEALGAVCNWAFGTLKLERIEAGCLVENIKSRAVLERLGFAEEGLARAYLEIAGKRQDHVLYGLVKDKNPL